MENVIIDINKKLKRDLEYIKTDIIAKQPEINKNYKREETEQDKIDAKYFYIKFSKILDAVAVMNMTKKQYKGYWNTQYKDYPDKLEIVLNAIDEKFNNGLTDRKEMIEIIRKSKDFQEEKKKAILLLKTSEELEMERKKRNERLKQNKTNNGDENQEGI